MELQLGGKIAIVTGASLGIGRAIVDELAAEGVHVALCARDKPLLEEAATAVQQQYDVQALPIAADLSTLTGVHTLASERAAYINGTIIPVDGGAIRCI